MEFFIPFAFIVVTMGLIVVLGYRSQRKIHWTMERIAGELGLRFQGASSLAAAADAGGTGGVGRFLRVLSPWRLDGTKDGVPVAAFAESRGSGRSRVTYTVVEAYHPASLGCGMRLGMETAMSKLGEKVFHLQDIKIGSDAFDAAVRIKGSDPERVKALLASSGVQDAVLRAMGLFPSISVTDTAVHYESRGTITTSDAFRPVLEALVSVVKAITQRTA